jgi:PadR family transcriptional regulator, regulatory protein AphA
LNLLLEKIVDIKFALLGFLSWQSFSGYDLKKMMKNSELFYWSGNNNQIYTGLVQLHHDGLVEAESQPSDKMSNRKVYRLTPAGKAELQKWLLTEPELPQFRKPFLIQMSWSYAMDATTLDSLLAKYSYELQMRVAILREHQKRHTLINPARTARERFLWQQIHNNLLQNYESELDWVTRLRREMPPD